MRAKLLTAFIVLAITVPLNVVFPMLIPYPGSLILSIGLGAGMGVVLNDIHEWCKKILQGESDE